MQRSENVRGVSGVKKRGKEVRDTGQGETIERKKERR